MTPIRFRASRVLGLFLSLAACGDPGHDPDVAAQSMPAPDAHDGSLPALPTHASLPPPVRAVSPDTAPPTPPPPPRGEEGRSTPAKREVACELRFRTRSPGNDRFVSAESWVWSVPKLAVSPGGGAWIGGTLHGQLDLGAGLVQSSDGASAFVHQLGPACEPLRTLVLEAPAPGDAVQMTALTVDAQGAVYVAYNAGPVRDPLLFGSGPVQFTNMLVVEKLSATGERVFRKLMPSNVGAYVTDLAVDDLGRIFVSGAAPGLSDFGGGPLRGLPTTINVFVLELAADGEFVAQQLDGGGGMLSISGEHVLQGQAGATSSDFIAFFFGVHPYGVAPRGLTAYRPEGLLPHWILPVDPEFTQHWASSGRSTGGAISVQRHSPNQLADDQQVVEKLDIVRLDRDGKEERRTTLSERRISAAERLASSSSTGVSLVRETPEGGALLAGQFTRTMQLGALTLERSAAGPRTPLGSAGAFLAELDAQDRVSWLEQQEWGGATVISSVAPSSGALFALASVFSVVEDPALRDVVVRKLRAPAQTPTLSPVPQ